MGKYTGLIVELDMSSGDVIEHYAYDAKVSGVALSDDKLVACNYDNAIRLFNLSTCSFCVS